jgi:hypothetical protein
MVEDKASYSNTEVLQCPDSEKIGIPTHKNNMVKWAWISDVGTGHWYNLHSTQTADGTRKKGCEIYSPGRHQGIQVGWSGCPGSGQAGGKGDSPMRKTRTKEPFIHQQSDHEDDFDSGLHLSDDKSEIDRSAGESRCSDESRHSVINRANRGRPQSDSSINLELTDQRRASRRGFFVGTYLEASDNEFNSDSDRNARTNDRGQRVDIAEETGDPCP